MKFGMKMIYLYAKDWQMWESTQNKNRQFFPAESHLIGWLIQEDREKVVIAMEYYPSPYGDEIRHIISIPRKCIIKFEELKSTHMYLPDEITKED